MCGRYTFRPNLNAKGWQYLVDEMPLFPARFNIAPTQPVVAVRLRDDQPKREAVLLRWGLIPSWSKDPKIGARCINARADTVAEKPAFRKAFQRRRCLIAADGFYEWEKLDAKKKQPWYFRVKGGEPFAFAGLWEVWKSPEGEPVES